MARTMRVMRNAASMRGKLSLETLAKNALDGGR